jgi:ADP-heptose:LPS heptosyltransferase
LKILVAQLYRIGDVLLTTPAVREIKKSFPNAEVDFLAEKPAAGILSGNPDIHELLVYDKQHPWAMIKTIRSRRYDWVIDFLGTPRTAILTALSGAKMRAGLARVFHNWAYNRKLPSLPEPLYVAEEKIRLLEPLGVKFTGDLHAQIKIPNTSRLWADNFYETQKNIKRPLIALSPVSRRHYKRWPLDRFAALSDRLISELNCAVLLLWGPGEKEVALSVSSRMKNAPMISLETKSLLDLAALMQRADLFVGNDNGVKHIAAASGIPTFTIYGDNSPISWTYPDSNRHRFIQKIGDAFVNDAFEKVKDFLLTISKNSTHLVK